MQLLRQKIQELINKNVFVVFAPVLSTILFFSLYMGQVGNNQTLDEQLVESKNDYALLQGEYSSLKDDFDNFKKDNKEFIAEGKKVVEKRKKALKDAEDTLEKLGNDLSRESLEEAKKFIETLEDENQRTKFMSEISSFETRIKEKEAEEAEQKLLAEIEETLKKMENDQTRENSQAATDKLAQLSNNEKKNQYQKRIDAVNHEISVREAEQQRAQAEAQQVAEQQQIQQFAQAPAQNVYYENCTAVRAAGAAPIYEGQPGYSRKLDRDGDGVACE